MNQRNIDDPHQQDYEDEWAGKIDMNRPFKAPTPRTDGITGTFYLRCDDCPQPEKCEQLKSVHPDDVRSLERSLSAADKRVQEAYEECERICEAVVSIYVGAEQLSAKHAADSIRAAKERAALSSSNNREEK